MRLVPNMHVLVPLVVKPATQAHKGIYGLAALTNLENPKPATWNAFEHSQEVLPGFDGFARVL